MPEAIEIAFDSPEDPQADPACWAQIDSRTDLWANSMWDSVSGGCTDEASLRDPDLGWQHFTDHGFEVPKRGHHAMSIRRSADTDPGGTVTIDAGVLL